MARVDTRQVAAALPSYEISAELGRGGFGTVLAGRHKLIGRDVAVKVLLDAASADDITPDRSLRDPSGPHVRARFLAEARVLAGLDHSHVVRIFDYVEHDGLCMLVMEQLTGGSLRSRAAGLGAPAACAIGLAAAAALAAAHDLGVLHRDVKPDNLLFTADGLLKVTDFGIAKILETTAATTTGMVGTPRYMAPEQIAGTRLGPATDLYALAVVLYELLGQRPPFDRQLSVAAILHHHLSVPPQPLREAPTAVAEVVLACLAKDPGARPASAHAFAVELAHAGTLSFGPDWLSRSGVPVRLADEVLSAAGHLSSGNTPPAGGHGLTPTRRDSGAFPSDTDTTSASWQPGYDYRQPPAHIPPPGTQAPPGAYAPPGGQTPPAGSDAAPFGSRGQQPYRPPQSAGERSGAGWPAPGGYPASRIPPSHVPQTRRDHGGGRGDRRRVAVIAAVATVCVLATGLGLALALGAFRGDGTSLASATPAYAGTPLVAEQSRTDGIAIGRDGTVYVTDYGSGGFDGRLLAISPDGTLRTLAGVTPGPTATPDAFGDGGPASAAVLRNPISVAVAPDGTLYVADYYGEQVRRIGTDGVITAFAGVGAGRNGFTGTTGEATGIDLGYPSAIAVGPEGVVYVVTGTNILKITPGDRIAPIAAGDKGVEFSIPAPTPAPSATAQPTDEDSVTQGFYSPSAIAVSEDGMIYVADENLNIVVRIDPATGSAQRYAGTADDGYTGDGGQAIDATLYSPQGLTFGPDGALYVTDQGNDAIRRIDSGGVITTVAGGGEDTDGDGAAATAVGLVYPTGIAIDSSGAIYYTTYTYGSVRRIGRDGILRTVLRRAE